MSVSIQEVIEAGGYDLTSYEDAVWLVNTQPDYEELVEQAEELIEKVDEERDRELELEYERMQAIYDEADMTESMDADENASELEN